MSPAQAAIFWSREFAHDVKARLSMDPCRNWVRSQADRHDPICDELASAIAAILMGHGINPTPAHPDETTRGRR